MRPEGARRLYALTDPERVRRWFLSLTAIAAGREVAMAQFAPALA